MKGRIYKILLVPRSCDQADIAELPEIEELSLVRKLNLSYCKMKLKFLLIVAADEVSGYKEPVDEPKEADSLPALQSDRSGDED